MASKTESSSDSLLILIDSLLTAVQGLVVEFIVLSAGALELGDLEGTCSIDIRPNAVQRIFVKAGIFEKSYEAKRRNVKRQRHELKHKVQ